MKKHFPLMRNNILRKDLDAVIRLLREEDPILTSGKFVKQFEEAWSNWLGVRYSVFVNSGSSANFLSMALLKLRFPKGGEVIVPPLTWVSDIVSVTANGFTPVFVDIDMNTLGMNSSQIIKKLTSKTRAVFITHAQGFNALTKELLKELSSRKIHLIEDVCESHGAMHNSKKLGSIGWLSNFSFYYAHHLSTIEGGMVCTNDEQAYDRLRMLRAHGLVREIQSTKLANKFKKENPDLNPEFIFAIPGYNFRNNEIGGVLGLSQLKRLDKNIIKRNKNFELFLNLIDSKKFFVEFNLKGMSNYAFNLIIRKPDHQFALRLMSAMNKGGIEFRRGSAGGGNQTRQPYLEKIVSKEVSRRLVVTEHIHYFGFYLGNYPSLTNLDIKQICKLINSV